MSDEISKWGKIQQVKDAVGGVLFTGSGMSKNNDAYLAGKEAAKKALDELNGKKPTVSYVFYSGDYDPFELTRGLMEILN